MNPSVSILGVKVNLLTTSELNHAIEQLVIANNKAMIPNVNVYALNLAFSHGWLREFFNEAPIVFCDGAGVILAGRLLGYKIPERITYADWMWQLAEFFNQKEVSFYFLGAADGIAAHAAQKLQERFPNLSIAGTHHGYFNKTLGHPENEGVIESINACKPNILVLGFGMPLQERWLIDNWDKIDANIALTGGAAFDYVSGNLRRGPSWLTDHGFEWLARLWIEPGRLWRRYVVGNPLFFVRLILHKFGLLRLKE